MVNHRRPKGASGGHKVSASGAAQISEAGCISSLLLTSINVYLFIDNRASLAYTARLADTLCLPEATFGRVGLHQLVIRGYL